MSVITFDTWKFAERLEKAGMHREHAKAEALADVLSSGTQELATKADIGMVRSEMRELKTELMREMKLNCWMLAVLIGLAIANFSNSTLSDSIFTDHPSNEPGTAVELKCATLCFFE